MNDERAVRRVRRSRERQGKEQEGGKETMCERGAGRGIRKWKRNENNGGKNKGGKEEEIEKAKKEMWGGRHNGVQ